MSSEPSILSVVRLWVRLEDGYLPAILLPANWEHGAASIAEQLGIAEEHVGPNALMGTIHPSDVRLVRNPPRVADTLDLTVPFAVFPIPPQAVRSMICEVFADAVSPAQLDEFYRTGRPPFDLRPRGDAAYGPVRPNRVFIGVIDAGSINPTREGTVSMQGRDFTALLIDHNVPPEVLRALDLAQPIHEVVQQLVDTCAAARGMRVYWRGEDGAPIGANSGVVKWKTVALTRRQRTVEEVTTGWQDLAGLDGETADLLFKGDLGETDRELGRARGGEITQVTYDEYLNPVYRTIRMDRLEQDPDTGHPTQPFHRLTIETQADGDPLSYEVEERRIFDTVREYDQFYELDPGVLPPGGGFAESGSGFTVRRRKTTLVEGTEKVPVYDEEVVTETRKLPVAVPVVEPLADQYSWAPGAGPEVGDVSVEDAHGWVPVDARTDTSLPVHAELDVEGTGVALDANLEEPGLTGGPASLVDEYSEQVTVRKQKKVRVAYYPLAEEMSYWDVITDLCVGLGCVASIEDDYCVIEFARTVFGGPEDAEKRVHFVDTHNCDDIEFSKDLGRTKINAVVLRCWDTENRRLLVSRFPPDAAETFRGKSGRRRQPKASERDVQRTIAGITSQAFLDRACAALYFELTRNKTSGRLSTAEFRLASGLTMFDLRAGAIIDLGPPLGLEAVGDVRTMEFEEAVAALERIGVARTHADRLAAALRVGVSTVFWVRELHYAISDEQGFEVEVNFTEIPTLQPPRVDPVTGKPRLQPPDPTVAILAKAF